MIRVRRPTSLHNLGILALATLTLVLSGRVFAEIPEGLRLDEPRIGASAESHVEVKDTLEEDKLAAEDPVLLWFRNGYHLSPDPGLDAVMIYTLFVDPRRRRQGLGRRMLGALAARYPDRKWAVGTLCPEEIGEPFLPATGFQRQELNQVEMQLSL